MDVTRAGATDAATLAELNQYVHTLHALAEPGAFREASPEQAIPLFASVLADDAHLIYLARVDDHPVGYLWAEDQNRPETPLTRASRTLYIHHVAVASDVRHRGVGRALVSAAESEARARGIRELGMDHWSFNEDAARFFRALGFEPCIVRMRRRLDD